MTLTDVRLTDPTAEEVASALRAAVAGLNGKRTVSIFSLPARDGELLGRRAIDEHDGRYEDSRAEPRGVVGRWSLAWWTNPAGRKLVRVRAWREKVHRR